MGKIIQFNSLKKHRDSSTVIRADFCDDKSRQATIALDCFIEAVSDLCGCTPSDILINIDDKVKVDVFLGNKKN